MDKTGTMIKSITDSQANCKTTRKKCCNMKTKRKLNVRQEEQFDDI